MAEQRKLATIMAIDLAGYSHAAEVDDGAAANAVAQMRAALDEVIAPHTGRVFSTAGDGFMVEFPSAVAAVTAARTLLDAVREQGLPRIRVGLHLGDVIVTEDGDLLGHGVNVAARLMQMAEPNTALVSQAVRTQVRQADGVLLQPLGRVQLDKMSEHVELYGLGPKGASFGRVATRQRKLAVRIGLVAAVLAGCVLIAFLGWKTVSPAGAPATPRLAVLRLENLGDTEPYFAEGVADEFISEASRIEGMDVVARASSFALTGEHATPADAARQLNATLVLTGSVRRVGGELRVHAALAEAPSGRQIWDQTFERPTGDVDQLQRDIAVQVARATGLRAVETPPHRVNPEAYDLYLRGREAWVARADFNPATAHELFRAATVRDPSFAKAWGWLARTEALVVLHDNYVGPPGVLLTRADYADAMRYADRAIALDSTLSAPYEARAFVLTTLGEWQEADAASRAVAAHGGVPYELFLWTGRDRDAVSAMRQIAALNPLDSLVLSQLASRCVAVGDWVCAEQNASRSLELDPDQQFAVETMFFVRRHEGDRQGARRVLNEHRGAWRRYMTDAPVYTRRYFDSLIGDAPREPASVLLDALASGRAHLDDVIWMLAQSGYTREAAALLPRWGHADRLYLPELYSQGLSDLRRTPEFWAVMEREGLVRYWRESGNWPGFCSSEPGPCRQYLQS